MYDEARSNIFKQGTKILHAIAEHYEMGAIEDSKANDTLMLLFGLIAEKKVSGVVCQDTGQIKWSLSKEYEKELEKERRDLYDGSNIVDGPWK